MDLHLTVQWTWHEQGLEDVGFRNQLAAEVSLLMRGTKNTSKPRTYSLITHFDTFPDSTKPPKCPDSRSCQEALVT